MENEIWKDIAGYEGKYQISNIGNVRSLKRFHVKNDREMNFHKSRFGYYRVMLKNPTKNIHVHTLVALSFVPNPENKPQVNHINGIKTDNRVENLEWCTSEENIRHAFSTGLNRVRYGEERKVNKLKDADIPKIKELHKKGITFTNIGKIYNVTSSAISLIVKNKRWKHILFFILLLNTSFAQDSTKKFCFTSHEMDYWISCSLDAKTYKNSTDSLFLVLDYCNEDKRQLKGIIDDCNSLNKSYKKTLRKRNILLYIWQGLAGGISALFVYREVTR